MSHSWIELARGLLTKNWPLKGFTLLVLVVASSPAGAQAPETLGPDDGPVVSLPSDQFEAGRRNRENLRAKGFVEMLDERRRVDEILSQIAALQVEAAESGRLNNPDYPGFMELDRENYSEYSRAPFNPAVLDERYLTSNSRSYMLDGSPEVTQLHTETRFGTLLIEEFPDTSSRGGAAPNTFIDGHPANIVQIKYDRGKWATAVYVQHGTSFFVVETDQRIAERDLPDFLTMVEELVIYARNKRN